MAHDLSGTVTGLGLNADWLKFAAQHDATSAYVQGDARELPFAENAFDCVCSITALCFVDNLSLALREIVRVTRKRFAIGMLNRHSVLWLEKGRDGGMGAYRGAHWHTPTELRRALEALPVIHLELTSAVFCQAAQRWHGGWRKRSRIVSFMARFWLSPARNGATASHLVEPMLVQHLGCSCADAKTAAIPRGDAGPTSAMRCFVVTLIATT